MRRIAVLPARGGSKRIKDKNIAPFCGRPMIHYPLAAAKDAGLFDKIHVSTDSQRVREAVERLGFPVDFMRSPQLADDHTPLMPVLRWVLDRYKERGERFDDVFLLLPCAPLIEATDLAAGHEVYLKHQRRLPVLAVSEFPVPIEWAFRLDGAGLLQPCQPGMAAVRSQDLGRKYFDSGTFVIFNADQVLGPVPPDDSAYAAYVLPKDKAVDVDTPEDWALAEALLKARRSRECPTL